MLRKTLRFPIFCYCTYLYRSIFVASYFYLCFRYLRKSKTLPHELFINCICSLIDVIFWHRAGGILCFWQLLCRGVRFGQFVLASGVEIGVSQTCGRGVSQTYGIGVSHTCLEKVGGGQFVRFWTAGKPPPASGGEGGRMGEEWGKNGGGRECGGMGIMGIVGIVGGCGMGGWGEEGLEGDFHSVFGQ